MELVNARHIRFGFFSDKKSSPNRWLSLWVPEMLAVEQLGQGGPAEEPYHESGGALLSRRVSAPHGKIMRQLRVSTAGIKQEPIPEKRAHKIRNVINTLGLLTEVAQQRDMGDPRLTLRIGDADHDLGFDATLTVSDDEPSDRDFSTLMTREMRSIDWAVSRMTHSDATARILRNVGSVPVLSLATGNDCSVGTDSAVLFDATSPDAVTLTTEQGAWTHSRQLIILAGAVAAAHLGDLATK